MRRPTVRTIEWPPGSGRRADYSLTELGLLASLRAQLDAGTLSPEDWMAQVNVIHDLKVDLGAEQLDD